MKKISVPKPIAETSEKLLAAEFEAYLVGGCVRDLLLDREPKDWDIATNAKPEEVLGLFPDSVYENEFGTVGVKTGSEDPRLKIAEVTTYRIEGRYTDKRHPDAVKFARTVGEDLSRRDFTVNAMALGPDLAVIDPHGGEEDLRAGVIRTVGEPEERFSEDALRLLRAVRLAAELGFEIEMSTRRAMEKQAGLLEMIAKERIRDEFLKIVMCDRASAGMLLLEETDLLRYILPELREGLGVSQNKHHIYSVFEHHIRYLDYAAKQGYPLEIRLAALLHDIGKPKTKEGDGPDATFYNHERVGAKMAARALERLRLSKDALERTVHLIRYHMFYYNVDEVSAAGVRRFLARVGPENVDDLLKVREADRIGSGVPKAVPYKMRHLLFMIDKVKQDPLSPKMLKVNGEDVMRAADIPAGPRVGKILAVLLEDVLDDPGKNEKKTLLHRVRELNALSDIELDRLAQKAREKKDESEKGLEEDMKRRHRV